MENQLKLLIAGDRDEFTRDNMNIFQEFGLQATRCV